MLKSLTRAIQGNPELDFIQQNPEFAYFEPFAKVIETYGEESSKIFWAVYMMEHPSSQFYRIPRLQRKKEIEENFLKGTIPWEELKDFSKAFMKYSLSKKEVQYKILADKMDDLLEFLGELDLKESATKAVSILKDMDKIWKSYDAIEKQVLADQAKGTLRGGGEKSHREKRMEKVS